MVIFFFKQKTAYEMRISDWSSDVCSSDLRDPARARWPDGRARRSGGTAGERRAPLAGAGRPDRGDEAEVRPEDGARAAPNRGRRGADGGARADRELHRTRALDREIGSATVLTPVTNAHLVCRHLFESNNKISHSYKNEQALIRSY